MGKLVLYSLFLGSILGSFWAAAATDMRVVSDGFEAKITPEKAENPYNFDHIKVENTPINDDFCLNIHAFLFKTDDDRVPKLVGETTCMRASDAKAKKVNRLVPPKLMPAAGENSF
jgi:hypothetical protein